MSTLRLESLLFFHVCDLFSKCSMRKVAISNVVCYGELPSWESLPGHNPFSGVGTLAIVKFEGWAPIDQVPLISNCLKCIKTQFGSENNQYFTNVL